MDAVKFVETLQRKIKNENRDEIIIRTTDDANLFVDLVEEWSREHPIKTRQSVFLKQYPEAEIGSNGVVALCPMSISANHRDSNGECNYPERVCKDCKREFWSQEVE